MTDIRIPLRHTTRVLPFDSAPQRAERYGLLAIQVDAKTLHISMPNGDHTRRLRQGETMLFDSTMSASHPLVEFPSWSISTDEQYLVMNGAVVVDMNDESMVDKAEAAGFEVVGHSEYGLTVRVEDPDGNPNLMMGDTTIRVALLNGEAIASMGDEWVIATLTGTDFLLPVDVSMLMD